MCGKRRAWWDWCHSLACTGLRWTLPTNTPISCPAKVQILDRTLGLAKRRARRMEQEWGLIFACPSIVSGGKKWQHRVQFFSPQSSKRGQADRWLPTSVLCSRYRWGTLHRNRSLSVCLWDTPSLLPPIFLIVRSKDWQTVHENYPEMVFNNHLVQSLNFLHFESPIKTNDCEMILNSLSHSELSKTVIDIHL